MDKDTNETWKPDAKVMVPQNTAVTSMVIYAECNELVSYDAQYCDVDATRGEIINMAIGQTKLCVKGTETPKKEPLTISPYKVVYSKEIYKPGMVNILTHVTGGIPLQYARFLEQLFLNKECRINLVTWDARKNKYIFVARSYYIDHLSIDRDSNNAVVASLVCYSPDHKMTLDKFCQAYTGQRFATDILTNGIARFQDTANLSIDKRDLMFLAYNKENADVKALSKNPASETEDNREEMIQAYLLQYNESFYDFICRIANRCGEFLYYEDGKLHLGLPEKTRSIMEMTSKDMTVLTPHGISYPKLKSKVKSGLKTGTFLYDSTSATNMSPEVGTCYKAAHNAPNNTSYKDFKIPDINMFQDGHFMAAILSAFASSTSAGVALGSVAFTGAMEAINTQIDKHQFSFRGIQRQVYDKLLEGLKLQPMNSETVTLKDNLTQEFFSQIRQLEEQVTDDMIIMDFDNRMPDASLASAVTIDDGLDKAYVVTKMEGVFQPGQQNHTISVVPRVSAPDSTDPGQAKCLSRTTDDSKALLVPPVLDIDSPLGTAPLEAVVKVAYDPYRLGRVRVKFLWQAEDDTQDPNLSDWIPMSTPFAGQKGNGGGIFMMPQAGTHVIVNFFDNDIYHPYISGSLYNKNQEAPGYGVEYGSLPLIPMPYSPANNVMTIQSANGHGITFSDDGNIDMISDVLCPSLGAIVKSVISIDKTMQKTDASYNPALNPTTLGDASKNWGQYKSGGITLADKAGFYNISMSSSKREIDIKCPLGQINMNAFTGINISAPNGDINIEGKNVSISAGSNLSLQAGTNVQSFGTGGGIFSSNLLATVIGSGIGYGAAMLTAFAAKKGHALDKAFDFNFLRSTWEVLLRPVEGTLSLSTLRNITMTAGYGKTVVPAYLQSDVQTGTSEKRTYRDKVKGELEADDMNSLIRIMKIVKARISEFYYRKLRLAHDIQDAVCSLQQTYHTLHLEWIKLVDAHIEDIFVDRKCPNKEYLFANIKKMQENVKVPITPDLAACINEALTIKEFIHDQEKTYTADFLAEDINHLIKDIKVTPANGLFKKALKVSASDLLRSGCPDDMFKEPFTGDSVNTFTDDDNFKKNLKVTQRNAYIAILKQVDTFTKVDNVKVYNDEEWQKFVKNLPNVQKPLPSTGEMIVGGIAIGASNAAGSMLHLDSLTKLVNADTSTQQIFNFNGKVGPYAFADVSSGGSILMSNNPGYTYRMSNDGTSFKEYHNATLAVLTSIIS